MKKTPDKPMIYLDNAATTWPKPVCVTEAMADAVINAAAIPEEEDISLL